MVHVAGFDKELKKLRENEQFKFIEDEIIDEEIVVHHARYEGNSLQIEALVNIYTKKGMFSQQIKINLEKR